MTNDMLGYRAANFRFGVKHRINSTQRDARSVEGADQADHQIEPAALLQRSE